MINNFQAVILGIVQGLTEFIPVSSSGHLVIIPAIFGWETHSLAFDTTLHLGTSLALIVYFYNDLKTIVVSFLSDLIAFIKGNFSIKTLVLGENTLLGFKLLVGTFPALLLGLLLNSYFETTFRSVIWTSVFILLGSVLMFYAEYYYSKKTVTTDASLKNMSYTNALVIGLFQALALFPGFSRSGSTISAGMLIGKSKEDAAKFSFLLSLPIILSAGIYQLVSTSLSDLLTLSTLLGFLFSFVFGLLAIKFLIGFLKSNKLYPFVIYRVLLAIFILLFFSHFLYESLML